MRRILILWGVVLGLMVSGCEGETKDVEVTLIAMEVVEKETVVERAAAKPTEAPSEGGVGEKDLSAERLIIRNAWLELVVRDTQAALDEITVRVNELGGYVVSSRLSKYGEGTRVSLTVRVPAESLDAVLAQWRDMALEVRSQNITGQDVTEEYTDLQAQLRHLEATEERLLTFMEETEDTKATLAVYAELRKVQGEIERIKGRVQYLEGASAMSMVSLELIPDVLAEPISVAGWRPQGTLRQALRSLVGTLQFLVDVLIWVVVYGLVVGVPVVGLVGLVWRWRGGKGDWQG